MMEDTRHNSNNYKMVERQLWNNPRASSTSSASSSTCTPFILPSGGSITLAGPDPYILTEDAVFQPVCTSMSGVPLVGVGAPLSLTDFKDPFYASTLPECYALAATTVIAYMLVIMLLITPRTFLHEGAVVLGRRGFTNGPSGANNGIGIGGRPWLQKVAASSVAIALTIATADTFAVAERQYNLGFMDAARLQDEVEKGLELRIFRVISDTFLWLAQAQTLIRLFPRQREKIIIKWTAFSLITLDVLFSILNNFYFKGGRNPRNFVEALPALSYLFQLSLSLLYCAWVIYYSLTKKRFAFYHQQMRNQCLVALLSLISVLIPVVFFVVDISKPEVAGWGDYVRWVGAAAASVVVWEWVERIEALERNEKKDGVLGREVFDGDEMLDSGSKSGAGIFQGLGNDNDEKRGGGPGGGFSTGSKGISWPAVVGFKKRYRPRATRDLESFGNESMNRRGANKGPKKKGSHPRPPLWPTRPAPAATPVSRTDTASVQSTVYAVRYHPLTEGTPPVRDRTSTIPHTPSTPSAEDLGATANLDDRQNSSEDSDKPIIIETEEDRALEDGRKPTTTWNAIAKANPFRKRNQGPPLEVSAHAVKIIEGSSVHGSSNRWDVRAKIEDFAVTQADRIRDKTRGNNHSAPDLPVTIIPAPTRRLYYEAALGELEQRAEQVNEFDEPLEPETQSTLPIQRPGDPYKPGDSNEPETQSTLPIQRPGDPYKPGDSNEHTLQQRGTLSFITAVPQERISAPMPEPMPPVPPLSRHPSFEGRANSSFISRNSPVQLRIPSSPILAIAPRNDGLAIMSIPAPARRPRSSSDSD